MALSYIVSEIKRDTGRKLRFFHFLCIRRPLRGWDQSEYYHAVWFGKTIMVCLPDGEKLFIDVSTEYRREKDGRRTDRHLLTAQSELCIASRGKNVTFWTTV